MTNYEYLKANIDNEEKIARLICDWFTECMECPARDYCGYKNNGMKTFLNAECEE
jgi:hypothetical protein